MPRRGAARRDLAPRVTQVLLVSTRYTMPPRVPAAPSTCCSTAGGSPAQSIAVVALCLALAASLAGSIGLGGAVASASGGGCTATAGLRIAGA